MFKKFNEDTFFFTQYHPLNLNGEDSPLKF